MRRRPSLELRDLRCDGPAARLQHQRFRRDASRAVRVGCEAACCERRGAGPRPRVQRGGAPLGRDGRRGRVPRGDGSLRRDAQRRRVVHAARPRGHPGALPGGDVGEADEAPQAERRRRAYEGQPARALQALPDRRRRATDRRQPSARHADRGRVAGCRSASPRGCRATHDPHLPAHAATRPPQPPRELPIRPRGAQGRRRRERRCPHLDPAPGRPRRQAIRSSSSSRRRRGRCSSRFSDGASTHSTDSASSRGSG